MAALLGGHVNIAYFNPSEVLPQIQAGTLRALAVSTAERVPVLNRRADLHRARAPDRPYPDAWPGDAEGCAG